MLWLLSDRVMAAAMVNSEMKRTLDEMCDCSAVTIENLANRENLRRIYFDIVPDYVGIK